MGADIHCYIEVVEKYTGPEGKNNEYVMCFAPNVWFGRNYCIFGLMAGVRGGRVLFDLKGIPENASLEVKKIVKEWSSDGHSHTWFSIEDLWKISDEFEKIEGSRYRNLDAIIAMMMELETENDTPRLIVFFDN